MVVEIAHSESQHEGSNCMVCVFSHINFVTQILNECSTDVVPTGMVRQTFARMLKLGV